MLSLPRGRRSGKPALKDDSVKISRKSREYFGTKSLQVRSTRLQRNWYHLLNGIQVSPIMGGQSCTLGCGKVIASLLDIACPSVLFRLPTRGFLAEAFESGGPEVSSGRAFYPILIARRLSDPLQSQFAANPSFMGDPQEQEEL